MSTDKLVTLLAMYKENPLAFIRDVIGASPTDQQIDLILAAVGENSRVAVKSCTSSGKTAVLAWLTLFFLICYPDCKMLVTAPTASQLFRVFRSELLLWHGRMNPLFKPFYNIMNDNCYIEGKKGTQMCSWITGSSDNKENFAGLHASKVVIMIDEASALPKEIFDTLYGTLSSGDTSFILVSNPVRAEGAFYDLFADKVTGWSRFTFTADQSPNVDKVWIKEVEEYYGITSDFYKMRVLGEFPTLSEAQFFSAGVIDEAMQRQLMPREYQNYQRILGCDVARFGNDSCVIADRQGPKLHNLIAFKGIDTVSFTEKILEYYQSNSYSAVAVDGIGVGSGVVDQLKRFDIPVLDINVSSPSTQQKTFYNLRSELYGEVRDWISNASLPYHPQLRSDLVGINYSYNNKLQIILESKRDMKKRGQDSPDYSDALALTFAINTLSYSPMRYKPRQVVKSSYLWA